MATDFLGIRSLKVAENQSLSKQDLQEDSTLVVAHNHKTPFLAADLSLKRTSLRNLLLPLD